MGEDDVRRDIHRRDVVRRSRRVDIGVLDGKTRVKGSVGSRAQVRQDTRGGRGSETIERPRQKHGRALLRGRRRIRRQTTLQLPGERAGEAKKNRSITRPV